MNAMSKTVGWTMLAGGVLCALLVAGLVSAVGPLEPGWIEINGEPLALAQFGAGHWLVGIGGTLLALLIVVLVVPLAVLLPLLLAGLLLGGGLLVALLALAGFAALVFSPLILLAGVAWLVWRLVRGDAAKARAKAGATIAG